MAHMYDRVVSIVSKQPRDRTERDIEVIMPWFRKKSDLFQNLHTDVVKDIAKNCVFREYSADEVVIRQGEKGDCFYIILAGYVSIYIDPAISDAEVESDIVVVADDDGEKELDRSKFGNYIGDITAGKCFGELALINKDCVRNATILTDVACDLLLVNRSLYNRSLREYQAQEFAERTAFVNEYPLFRNWQHKYKKQMAFSLRKETVPFDTTLVKQGDPVKAIFFLLRGQAKLVVDPIQHSHQFPAWYPIDDIDTLEKDEARGTVKLEKSGLPERCRSADQGAVTPSVLNRRRNANRCLRTSELCVIGPVEVCGDLELSLDLNTYVQSVVTNEESDVYVLDMKNYERLVIRRNPRTVEAMRLMVETKLHLRCDRLLNGQLPLLKLLLFKLRCLTQPKKEQGNLLDRTKNTLETAWKVLELQRGPVVDLYGPGTVFYRIRMRERAKQEARVRAQGIVGGSRFGFAIQNFGQPRNSDVSLENEPLKDASTDAGHSVAKEPLLDHENILAGSYTVGGRYGDDYSDWASSDTALTQLEEKIRAWHGTFEDNSKARKRTVRMHRYHPEDNQRPKPGKKVLVRKKIRQKVVGFREFSDDDGDDDDDFLASLKDRNLQRSNRVQADDITVDAEASCRQRSRDAGQARRPTLGVISFKKDRPKRKYTAEQYEILKETLRHQQRSFGVKTRRPRTAGSPRRYQTSRAIPV